jgi:hypothetical protein
MLRILTAFLKLVHAVLITRICMQLSAATPILGLQVIATELGFSIVSIFITRKHRFDVLQIAISLCLSYTLIPNRYSFLSGLFFFKIVYIFNALGEAIEDLLSAPGNNLTRMLKILLSLFRYTLVEYLFLGLCLLAYKVYTMGDPEGPIPDDYITLYQLVVTATTIGYGDITPKSPWQIQFFTYTIPFICASFVVYFNAAIPIIGELIDALLGNSLSGEEGCNAPAAALGAKNWSSEERESFVNFIDEVARRQAEHDEHHKRLGHNWIALTANHYERQIPLINQFVNGDESKEVRLKISSKIRRQYYPAGWTILNVLWLLCRPETFRKI